MNGYIFALVSTMMVVTTTYAVEGEMFMNSDGTCTIERANGVEEPMECPKYEIKTLSKAEIVNSIASLSKFEKSELSTQAKKASADHAQKKQLETFRANHSNEAIDKMWQIKDGKYLVSVVLLTDGNYPRKYSGTGIYYVKTNQRHEEMDDTFAAQWDSIILSDLLGSEYSRYSPKVTGVGSSTVSLQLLVESSSQLEPLLQSKKIYSLTHAGLPTPKYQDIQPPKVWRTEQKDQVQSSN